MSSKTNEGELQDFIDKQKGLILDLRLAAAEPKPGENPDVFTLAAEKERRLLKFAEIVQQELAGLRAEVAKLRKTQSPNLRIGEPTDVRRLDVNPKSHTYQDGEVVE